MQIWIHDNKMKKIVALNNDIPDMMSYTNSSWHSYLDQATSTFDFTIPKFSNGELHEDLKLINDECFVSFYVNGSYQVFYIATLQEDDFNIQLTCNNTNLEYALEYANPFSADSAQTIEWYLNQMELLAFAAVEIGNNEIPDRKRTLTFDSQETKMNRLQSLMSKFEAEFEFKVELNRDGTYKRIVINIYQEVDDTHHGIGTDRKDVVLYYSNGLKGVQVNSDKTQMFNAAVFTGKDGLSLNDVEISEKNADGIEEFYSRKGNPCLYAPIAMNRYPATMRAEGQDNWIRKDFTTEYENVNDLKAYALRTLKQYAYPLVTYTASVQSGFVSHYTDLKLGDTIRIIDKNFVGGLALEARVSEMIISFDNPANNSFVFTNYRKLDNKPSSALQTRIEQVIESRLSYRIELATTGGVTFKNNEGETIIKPSLYKGNLPWTKDVTWHWTLNGVVTDGMQYHIQARDITDTAVLTVDAFVDGKKVATTEITLTNINDGPQGPQGPQGDEGPQGPQGDEGPQGPQGDTGNGIANTVVTYGLSMSDTTEPATWSSSVPTLVKGMYLWTRTVIIYTNGESTTSYQISYIAKDADATAAIDKTKQELLEKLETVRDDSLAAVEEAKQELANVNTKVDNAKAELTQAKQELTNVTNDLSQAKTDLQTAVSSVDTKATNLQSDLSKAKQDLTSQAQQLQTQASAQSELTNRVSSVEETANSTKTTVSELSKTVAQNGKDITSVTARTKVVEDDLAGTKTTLSQVKTTADSTSQKTATLETGLNGLSARFDSLSVGGTNLIKQSTAEKGLRLGSDAGAFPDSKHELTEWIKVEPSTVYTLTTYEDVNEANMWYSMAFYSSNADDYSGAISRPTGAASAADLKGGKQYKSPANAKYAKVSYPTKYAKVKFERGNIATDYSPNEADLEQKVAEYKQNADQNYASLQSTVQALDGTVTANKATAEQTAQGFKTRIESLETYKNGESERANAYFESAKTETAKQLTAERTAIANNYVAKSTYTSDVTGIRNDLTATTTTANTTKTNLANYQASNDRAVANLQSNLQEANGNISSLKTKVEAVPGQITSAVSAVEGKIPTSVGARNYIRNYGLTATGWGTNKAGWKFEIISDSTAKSGRYLKATCTTASTSGGGFYKNLFDFSDGRFFGKQMTWSMDIKLSKAKSVKIGPEWSRAYLDINATTEWKRYSNTFTVATTTEYKQWIVYTNDNVWNVGDIVYIRDVQLEDGSIATSPVPAIEDTESDITKLSSELTQTKDGITLLATKTELNTAKNELQSGINTATNKANSNAQTISTHTTQISALNTGLQAKVSQTAFNTLSGRVTSAENNITAKANELSSKITSVEGKIPTTVGGRNYALKTGDSKSSTAEGKLYDLSSGFDGIADNATLIIEFDWSVTAPTSTSKFRINRVITYSDGTANQWDNTIQLNDGDVATAGRSGHYSGTFKKIKYNSTAVSSRYLNLNQTTASGTVTISNLSVRVGSLKSDWSPAPEDTAEQISSLSSELTQTKDGITLLATKTELNTAKNELQSGINTATNKANSNAQTISTHTTQISALNTGLQAKVSQTAFNTLSGRVTSAENNITAKANELSSKITSVEGKIPTNIGTVNLIVKSTAQKGFRLAEGGGPFADNSHMLTDWIKIEPSTVYTLTTYEAVNESNMFYSLAWYSTNNSDYSGAISRPTGAASAADLKGGKQYKSPANAKYAKVSYPTKYAKVKFERGNIATDWSPAPEDYDSKLAAAQSEFKQTTDAIKASVSSLDKSTVKSSSLTINSDGIVMKAGKSTTDVANAIGSYFAVNQNAINLFSDKINVKGSMIVDGAITGDKIKANSVDVSKISGLDANFIKSKVEYAMIDWLKGKTIVADNGATKIDLLSGYINFDSDTPAIRRVTPGIPTQFVKFLKSGNNSVTTIGSNRDGSESSTNDSFAGIKITSGNSLEQTEIISDQIYFLTGVSSGNRRGWQMSTISGEDDRQITLFPSGNPTKSNIYASDYFIRGSDRWVNLLDFIDYFNTCLKHLQNYTGRYDIWNPFKL